ncbi:MAG: hypothetical protein PHD37_03295 [Gallionellaceae bacterium]|nr:hypothetical protein [Gallionellaceae bacterium]
MKTTIALTICLATGFGSASAEPQKRNFEDKELIANTYTVRAAVTPNCPISNEKRESVVGAVLAAIAPTLVEKAVDWAAASAKAAGDSKSSSAEIATTYTNMYITDAAGNLNFAQGFGCLVIVAGDFGKSDQKRLTGTWKNDTLIISKLLASDPRIYIEMAVNPTQDGSHFVLIPKYLYFDKPAESSWFRNDTRAVNLSLSFFRSQEKEPFASANIMFPRLTAPTNLDMKEEDVYSLSTGYLAAYPIDDRIKETLAAEKANMDKSKVEDEKVAQIKNVIESGKEAETSLQRFIAENDNQKRHVLMGYQKPFEDALSALCKTAVKQKVERTNCPDDLYWKEEELRYITSLLKAISDGKSFTQPNSTNKKAKQADEKKLVGYTTIQVSMVETRDGNAFLKLVGDVLDGSKAEIKAAATEQLPGKRKDAKEKEQTDNENLVIAAAGELAAVKKLEAKVAQETDPVEKGSLEADLLVAKIKANQAYRKAGIKQPYDVGL